MALTPAQQERRRKEIAEFTDHVKSNFPDFIGERYGRNIAQFMHEASAEDYNSCVGDAFALAANETYQELGYENIFEEADDAWTFAFNMENLPREYDNSGLIKIEKIYANAMSFRVRGGKNSPCSEKPVVVSYFFEQLTPKQQETLIARIAADSTLLKRCQQGYFDIRLFDLCAELDIKLLPLRIEDFYDVVFQESVDSQAWHNKEEARAITPTVLVYFSNLLESPAFYSLISYMQALKLDPAEFIQEQRQQSEYGSLKTIPQLLEIPLSEGIKDSGATLTELAEADNLPLSDAGIFSICGDITVPKAAYDMKYLAQPYEEYCKDSRKIYVDRMIEVYEKARKLAKTQLHCSDATLPQINDEGPQLILYKNGIVKFDKDLLGIIKKNYHNKTIRATAKPTDYDHQLDLERNAYCPYGVYISGCPEMYFFDGASLARSLKGKAPKISALCCLWQIATKLVIAGDFMPQLYYIEESKAYSIRWIPDVRIEAVRNLCAQTGYALNRMFDDDAEDLHIFAVSIDFPEYPPIDPAQLGVTVLSKFIQSYVYTAAIGKVRRKMPNYLYDFFPFSQCYVPKDECEWYFDALLDILIPFCGVTGDIRAVLLLETCAPEESGLIQTPAAGNQPGNAQTQAGDAGTNPYDPLFSVTLAFRDLDAEGGKEYAEDEVPPVITYEEVMNDDRFLRFRLQASLKQQSLDQILPGMITNDRPRCRMHLSELSDKIITAADSIKAKGFDIIMPRELRFLIKPALGLSLGIKGTWDEPSGFLGLEKLLDFDWQIALGDRKISLTEFFRLLKKAGQIVRFADQYVYISKEDAIKMKERLKAKPSRASNARLIAVALSGQYGAEKVFVSRNLKASIAALLKEQDLEIPREIKAVLRPYQVRGFRWLARNMLTSMGSILADDMGLGKTLELITALQYLKNKGELTREKALVVVPTAVIINWSREIAKFAPDLSCNLFYGQNTDPGLIAAHDVTVTTYGTMRSHEEDLSAISFRVIALDEAQTIKNTDSQVYKAASALKGRAMVAMTGTPVENRLLEYWAIMDFVNAGLLGPENTFKKEIATPIEKDRDQEKLDLFRTITAPFILRRLKTDKKIIADLPDKTVTDQFCELTPVQTALYEAVVEEGLKAISQSDDQFSRGRNVLLMMLKLKQICNAPEQFSEESTHKGAEFSGKAEALFEILDELGETGRKCLIFTQFKKMGDILTDWIYKKTGREPQFIHGGVTVKKRTEIVDKFQTDPDERVLILSLKAAGTGLNLTAATAVIHYDLWWNPAVEEQATDRAYRIGQRKDVQVFRLICANTFEERINDLIASKRELSDLTVVTGEQWIGNLDDNELSRIFRLTQ